MLPEEIIIRELKKLHEKVDVLTFDIKHIKKNNINMGDQRILDVFDIGLILKISERHVRRMIKDGKLKGFKLGKRRLFVMSEIIEYLKTLPQ